MKFLNRFTGKIVSDLDPSNIPPDSIVFPTVGIRILNKEGKGLIASTVPGNTEIFSLTDGFYCIGGCEYDGIAFIFSLNDTTQQGEIGTYPSPNLSVTGFTKAYSPLMNFDGGAGIGAFRTTAFYFNKSFPIEASAKKSYDDSYDIYFNDWLNTDKVVNSGFKSTGLTNNRTVKSTYFDGAINLNPTSNQITLTSAAEVQSGGFLKPGNYYIYYRYLTSDYASTNFMGETGPLSAAMGSYVANRMGLQEKDWIRDTQNVTDKKISLTLTQIDANYAFIQVGVVRYSATTENGPAQPDVYLIPTYYPISGSSMNVTIYGNEDESTLTLDDIVKPPMDYLISRTQVQLDNRLLRANMKKSTPLYQRFALALFSYLVTVGENNDTTISTPTKRLSWFDSNNPSAQYDDPANVYSYLGYFKNEIYPFGIVFLLDDGTETEAFPCKGNLDLSGSKGLYKFNSWQAICGVTPTQTKLTAVTFNTNSAVQYATAHPEMFTGVKGFYFVRGSRIENMLYQGVLIRGFNGILVEVGGTNDTYREPHSFQVDPIAVGVNNVTPWNKAEAGVMPLIRGFYPMVREQDGTTGKRWYVSCNEHQENPTQYFDDYGYITLPPRVDYTVKPGDVFQSFINSTDPLDHKHGLFSPDLLFQTGSVNVPNEAFIRPLFSFTDKYNDRLKTYLDRTPPSRLLNPDYESLDLNEEVVYEAVNGIAHQMTWFAWATGAGTYIPCSTAFVEQQQQKGKLNFTSYMPGDGDGIGMDVWSKLWNRNIGTSRYIGVKDDSANFMLKNLFYDSIGNESLSIVDICKYSSDAAYVADVLASYNPAVSTYTKISGVNPLTSATVNYTIWKGDCFLNKTWFRSHRWFAMEKPNQVDAATVGFTGFGSNYVDPSGIWYQHGFLIGITTESKYNAGMRNEVVGVDADNLYRKYTFFPKCMEYLNDVESFIVIEPGDYLQEALQINAGYDKVASDKQSIGYNVTQPVNDENKPNRVYASDKHIAGSFIDGFRSTQIGSFQDYAQEDGEIFKIKKNLDFPFLIQYSGINQIFLDERAIGQSEAGQDIILGASVAFLSDKVKKIGWFGTQHKSSVIDGTHGTYGFDFMQRVWWFVNTVQTQNGYRVLQAEDISRKFLVYNEIKKFIEQYSAETDIASLLPDDPLSGSGIVGFADRENDEVGMTFLIPKGPVIPSPDSPNNGIPENTRTWLFRTMIFNEALQGFRGDYPFAEALYLNLGSMLMSQHFTIDQNYYFNIGNKFYRYSVPVVGGVKNFATFFGTVQDTVISFIVNGLSEKDAGVVIEKIFNALEMESAHVQFKTITFATKYQTAVYDFSTVNMWETPEYTEHKWRIPIMVQTSADSDAFTANSELRGTWMKVTIVYNGSEDIELKNVITDFDVSFV